jgi:hypothetical protein
VLLFASHHLAEDTRPKWVAGVAGAVFPGLNAREKTVGLNSGRIQLFDGPSCPAFSVPGAIAGFQVNIDHLCPAHDAGAQFPANEAGVAGVAV